MNNDEKLMNLLDSTNVELHAVISTLQGVIHPDILARLTEIQTKIYNELKPYYEEQDRSEEDNYEKLEKIADENKFSTTWSISEVPANQMNEEALEVLEIKYESWGPTQFHKFDNPKKLTWLELWKIGDTLVRQSGDTHHIFIEGFKPIQGKQGHFSLETGS